MQGSLLGGVQGSIDISAEYLHRSESHLETRDNLASDISPLHSLWPSWDIMMLTTASLV